MVLATTIIVAGNVFCNQANALIDYYGGTNYVSEYEKMEGFEYVFRLDSKDVSSIKLDDKTHYTELYGKEYFTLDDKNYSVSIGKGESRKGNVVNVAEYFDTKFLFTPTNNEKVKLGIPQQTKIKQPIKAIIRCFVERSPDSIEIDDDDINRSCTYQLIINGVKQKEKIMGVFADGYQKDLLIYSNFIHAILENPVMRHLSEDGTFATKFDTDDVLLKYFVLKTTDIITKQKRKEEAEREAQIKEQQEKERKEKQLKECREKINEIMNENQTGVRYDITLKKRDELIEYDKEQLEKDPNFKAIHINNEQYDIDFYLQNHPEVCANNE